MMAVSINTRPSIRVVRTLPSASGWRAMLSVDGNTGSKGFQSNGIILLGLGSGFSLRSGGGGQSRRGQSQRKNQNTTQNHHSLEQLFHSENSFHVCGMDFFLAGSETSP